jgi:hypothetical protein
MKDVVEEAVFRPLIEANFYRGIYTVIGSNSYEFEESI